MQSSRASNHSAGPLAPDIGYLHLHQTSTADDARLVTITVSHGGNASTEMRWLPDSGAEVDAMAWNDFDRLPNRSKMSLPGREVMLAANGKGLGPVGVFMQN